MFLPGYLLACEISTVRTQTLTVLPLVNFKIKYDFSENKV